MGSPKGPQIQDHASVKSLQKRKRPRERSRSPRTPTSSSDNLTFQVSSQRLMVAKGDPQPTSPVMIATPLIIYIASRSRPVPTDAEHGQGDDEAGGLNGLGSYVSDSFVPPREIHASRCFLTVQGIP